jgi:2-amino-4-hydroxy-6-hydroxymethyldihydropteridine diphosphokinase
MNAFLSLGSNLGDKPQNLEKAYSLIEENIGKILQKSPIFETEAWGNKNQDSFFNSAIEIQTEYYPFELLTKIQEIEINVGRVKSEKWGPRVIDIDILYFEKFQIKTDNLTIPHPFIHFRRFVLKPLSMIASDFYPPNSIKEISELLKICEDTTEVKLLA